jgi:hypothetical protein
MKAAVAAAALLVVMACGGGGGGGATASHSPSPLGTSEPSPLARASGQLDAEVSVPSGFPGDVPVYTKARLTAGATFKSSGQVSWGMEWQTLDSVAKVQAFYADKMNQADWTITFTNKATNNFSATFARKSNSNVQGTLGAGTASGVTRISMSLVSPA